MKTDRSRFYVIYTILFISFAWIAFSLFFLRGKSFIWKVDGLYQHYNAFVYYGEWLRGIVRTLVCEHRLKAPLWEFGIGYGGDVIHTLAYYVIGDPFALISVVTPASYAEAGYTAALLLRFYAAGFAFCACARKLGAGSFAALSASMMYLFCAYTYVAIRHPYFIGPMIYLPLLVLGAEKILRRERPYVYIFAVFLAAVSNFYFFYMLALFTALYVMLRLLCEREWRRWKNLVPRLGVCFGFALVGVMMAAVLFLPVAMYFLSNTRISSAYQYPLFYSRGQYEMLLGSFVGLKDGTDWNFPGMVPFALLGVGAVMMERGRYLWLKLFTAFLVSFMLLPFMGHVFNGFGYVTNRWVFAWLFAEALCFALGYPLLLRMGRRRKLVLAGAVGGYTLLCLLLPKARTLDVMLGCVFLIVFLVLVLFYDRVVYFGHGAVRADDASVSRSDGESVFRSDGESVLRSDGESVFRADGGSVFRSDGEFVFRSDGESVFRSDGGSVLRVSQESASRFSRETAPRFSRKAVFRAAAMGLIAVCVFGQSRGRYVYKKYADEFVDRGTANEKLRKGRAETWSLIGDDSFYRIDNTSIKNKQLNYALSSGQSTTTMFWSLVNPRIVEYLQLNGAYARSTYNFRGLTSRSWLLPAAAVKYYVSGSKKSQQATVPYPFVPFPGEDPTLYQTDAALPFGYTFDSVLPMEKFQNLTVAERQQALLQSAVIGPEDMEAADVLPTAGLTFTDQTLPCELRCGEGAEVSGNRIVTTEKEAAVTLLFDCPAECELYVQLEGLEFESTRPHENVSEGIYWKPADETVLRARCADAVSEVTHFTPWHKYAHGREDYLLNLYYSDSGRTTATLTFSERGIYTFDRLKVIAQPMEGLREQVDAAREDVLQQVEMTANTVTGTIDPEEDKLLCLSLPYAPGWHVSVDGEPAELLRVNVMYSGVMLTAGRHRIKLNYRTPYLTAGWVITLTGFCIFLLIWRADKRREEKA